MGDAAFIIRIVYESPVLLAGQAISILAMCIREICSCNF